VLGGFGRARSRAVDVHAQGRIPHSDNAPKADRKKKFLALVLVTSPLFIFYQKFFDQGEYVIENFFTWLTLAAGIFALGLVSKLVLGEVDATALNVQRGQCLHCQIETGVVTL